MKTPLELVTILQLYELDDYYIMLLQDNPAMNRPYHNNVHVKTMTRLCHEIIVDEIVNGNQSVQWSDIRIMLLSALFHDWGHHSKVDAENIETAIKAFRERSHETEEVNLAVEANIRCTQYPYVVPEEELHLIQKIMRDADTLQWSEGDIVEHVVKGIASELEISIPQMLEGQRKFMKNLKFRTRLAQEIADRMMSVALAQLDQFERDYF